MKRFAQIMAVAALALLAGCKGGGEKTAVAPPAKTDTAAAAPTAADTATLQAATQARMQAAIKAAQRAVSVGQTLTPAPQPTGDAPADARAYCDFYVAQAAAVKSRSDYARAQREVFQVYDLFAALYNQLGRADEWQQAGSAAIDDPSFRQRLQAASRNTQRFERSLN